MYVFAIIIVSMAFLNAKLTVYGNIVTLVANILRIVIHWENESAYQTAAFIDMFTLLLVAIASITVTKLLLRFNQENTESIMEAANKQEASNNITNIIEELNRGTHLTNESMLSILSSTDTISENISQLSATSEEVAASSTEGLKTSETAVENMNSCRQILEDISLLAQKLKA